MKAMKAKDAYFFLCQAQKDMRKALEVAYPIGSTVLVELKRGQKNLSEMKVINCSSDGYVVCEMYTKNKWYPDRFNRYVRNVFFKNIHGVT